MPYGAVRPLLNKNRKGKFMNLMRFLAAFAGICLILPQNGFSQERSLTRPKTFITRIYDPAVGGRVDKKEFIAYKNPEELFKEVQSGDHIVMLGNIVLEKNRGYHLKDNALSGLGDATTITIPAGSTLKMENSRAKDLTFKGGKRGLIIANSRLSNVKYDGGQKELQGGLIRNLPDIVSSAHAAAEADICEILNGQDKISLKGAACFAGVFVVGNSKCEKCEFYNNDIGVFIGAEDKQTGFLTLEKSNVHDNKQGEFKIGVYVAKGSSLVAYKSNIADNGFGISAYYSQAGVKIFDSVIGNNDLGGIFADGASSNLSPLSMTISDSKLLSNGFASSASQDFITSAIYLKNSVYLEIKGSHIDNNQVGILFSQGSYVYAHNNKFTMNAFGALINTELLSLFGSYDLGLLRENIFNGNGIGIFVPPYFSIDLGTADDPGGNYFISASRCNIFNSSESTIFAMGNWWDWSQKEKPSFGNEAESLKIAGDELTVCKIGSADVVNYQDAENPSWQQKSITLVEESPISFEVFKNWKKLKEYQMSNLKIIQEPQE
jgi:hypothetical protein